MRRLGVNGAPFVPCDDNFSGDRGSAKAAYNVNAPQYDPFTYYSAVRVADATIRYDRGAYEPRAVAWSNGNVDGRINHG